MKYAYCFAALCLILLPFAFSNDPRAASQLKLKEEAHLSPKIVSHDPVETCPDGVTQCGDEENYGYYCCWSWWYGIYECCHSSWNRTAIVPISQNNVVCQNGAACPEDKTCCKMAAGDYGCCPWANAVCCSDGINCCPEGWVCDQSGGACKNPLNGKSMEWYHKYPSPKFAKQLKVIAKP